MRQWSAMGSVAAFLVVCGALTASVSAEAAGRTHEYCRGPLLAGSQPTSVVVFIDGVGSQEEGGQAYPLPVKHPARGVGAVGNYCPVGPAGRERGWPPGIKQGLRRWAEFSVPGGSSGGSSSAPQTSDACQLRGGLRSASCLVARLADAGAVLLPYSYQGARLERTDRGVRFRFSAYSGDDTKRPPVASVVELAKELASIHSVWRGALIVVVGHSYGGLVAEEWWQQHSASQRRRQNVAAIFSLDSPINGVDHCFLAQAIVGPFISTEFCNRWDDRDQLDQRIISLDGDKSYTAVGTPNDPTYTDVFSGGGDLRAQGIYSCPDDGHDAYSACIARPPSTVSHDPACDASGSGYFGTTGHDLVKACPEVVRAIVGAAKTPWKCNPPRHQFAGPHAIQARGVTCAHARHYASTSPICRIRTPQSHVTCHDRGYLCVAGPGTVHTNYSIPVHCKKGRRLIRWLAGY